LVDDLEFFERKEDAMPPKTVWSALRRLLWVAGLATGLLVFLGTMGWRAWQGARTDKAVRLERAGAMLRALGNDLRDKRAAERMQGLFPEGATFTLSLYAQGLVNICLNNPEDESFRKLAQDEILWVLARLSDPFITRTFPNTQVPHGVFFFSHRTLLIAGLHLVSSKPPAELTEEYHKNCHLLYEAFLASPQGLLDSYPDGCWPADNILAVRCLVLHNEHFGADHSAAINKCLDWIRQNLDAETGTIPHRVDSGNGKVLTPTRGCTMVLGLQYLLDVDPEMFTEQYVRLREHFLGSFLGLATWREYPVGRNGPFDVDSGPVILGNGSSATGVGMGTALLAGDEAAYCNQAALVESFAFPSGNAGERRYWSGLLPVADAFAVCSMSAVPWSRNAQPDSRTATKPSHPWTFVITLGGICVVSIALLSVWCIRIIRSIQRVIREGATKRNWPGALAFFLQALPLLLLVWSPILFLAVWLALGVVWIIVGLFQKARTVRAVL